MSVFEMLMMRKSPGDGAEGQTYLYLILLHVFILSVVRTLPFPCTALTCCDCFCLRYHSAILSPSSLHNQLIIYAKVRQGVEGAALRGRSFAVALTRQCQRISSRLWLDP